MHSYSCFYRLTSIAAGWSAFVRAARVFGAYVPAEMRETLEANTAASAVAEVLRAASAVRADPERFQDHWPVPVGVDLEITPTQVVFRFGAGRSLVELTLADGDAHVRVGTHQPAEDCPGAEESLIRRWHAAFPEDDYRVARAFPGFTASV